MDITCSCTHKIKDMKDGEAVTYKDYNRVGELCEVTAFYCKECARELNGHKAKHNKDSLQRIAYN